jgi:hypothetical protein
VPWRDLIAVIDHDDRPARAARDQDAPSPAGKAWAARISTARIARSITAGRTPAIAEAAAT